MVSKWGLNVFSLMEDGDICAPTYADKEADSASPNFFSLLLCYMVLFGAGGNSGTAFDVEKVVGTIIIAKPLDAEQRTFYNLTVLATDGTNTAYSQVTLFLIFSSFLLFVCMF